VSEGHGHPLVLYNDSKHNILLALVVGKANNELAFQLEFWSLQEPP
jgi:hypothetical protein